MSYGKAVREELREPARELQHAIPQVYAGYKELRFVRDFARKQWPPAGAVRLMS